MLKIICIIALSLFLFNSSYAGSSELGSGKGSAHPPKTQQPKIPKDDKISSNKYFEILQDLKKQTLELKNSKGTTCPAANFDIRHTGSASIITIYDKKEDGVYFGNGVMFTLMPDQKTENEYVLKTKEGTQICKDIVTRTTRNKSTLQLISIVVTEKTCNGITTTTRETFEINKGRGGKLNVSYKDEVSRGKNKWTTNQLCTYGPPRNY